MERITSRQRKRIYNSLQQTHLPKLDRAGLVEYDAPRGYVTLTNIAARLDIYLEIVDERELPWAQFYLGLGSLSIVLMLAVWIEEFPFALLPDIVWGGFVATALLLSGIAHTMSLRASRLGDGDVPPEIRKNRR